MVTQSSPSQSTASEDPVRGLFIGRLSNYDGYYFTGSMSDFRLYDTFITAEQAQAMFSNGPGGDVELTALTAPIPATITVQEKTSTKVSCLVEGDPNSTYNIQVAGGQTVSNIKSGDVVDIEDLTSNTSYTLNLY